MFYGGPKLAPVILEALWVLTNLPLKLLKTSHNTHDKTVLPVDRNPSRIASIKPRDGMRLLKFSPYWSDELPEKNRFRVIT